MRVGPNAAHDGIAIHNTQSPAYATLVVNSIGTIKRPALTDCRVIAIFAAIIAMH